LDVRKLWNAAPGTDLHALHSCSRVGEADHIFQVPVLNKTINKSAMKDISCARRIGDRNFEGGRLYQLAPVQEDRAFRTLGNSYYGTAIPIGKLSRVLGEVGTRNKIVDKSQELMRRIVINLININNDRNSCLPRPARSLKSGRGVAAVKMKNSAVGDEIALQLSNWILQRRVTPPQNRSFADTFFQENNGDLADRSLNFANVKFKILLPQAR